MPSTSPRARSSFGTTTRVVAAVIGIVAGLSTAPASAATLSPNYVASPLTYANGTNVQQCRGWAGDADDAGRFYSVCLFLRDLDGNGTGDSAAPALVEYSSAGRVQRIGWLPSEYWFGQGAPANYVALDVGVSPDGNTAYVTTGPNIDNLGQRPDLHPYTKQPLANGARSGSILRLRRQADGSWTHDTSWRAGPFLLGGNYWAARRLDVDGSGRVYVSVNAYVFELNPATGAVASNFGGGITDGPGGRWIDGIDKAQGLAVAADGNSIHVVDQQHQIVQRWLRVGATDWKRDTTFLLGVPDEVGDYCATTDHFQSPYDVAVDAAGDVYVMDTTCNRVQRFTGAGTFVQTTWQDRTNDTLELSHGFAVNWQGSVLLPTALVVLTRMDPPTRPGALPAAAPGCVDRTRPRIIGVRMPVRTTARGVRVEVDATDDCGVTHMRVLGHRKGRARWIAATATTVSLSGWNGRRTLVVQVRDKGSRVTTRRVRIVLALPQPRLRARSVVRLGGTGCSSVDPLRRVADRSSYRLVDRCARIAGRVLRVQGSGTTVSAEVLLPVRYARAIYANAVGPVKIWVVADSRTRVTRTVRRGRPVVVVGSVLATRDLRYAYAIPVDVLSGR